MSGTAIVIGSGRTVWDDLRALCQLGLDAPTYFAVNDMIVLGPHCDHAVSHHPDKLVLWAALHRTKVPTHSSASRAGVDHAWPQFRQGPSGSSALLATRIALELGHESVIVVGVPLDASGYVWGDPLAPASRDFARYRIGWQAHRPLLDGRVTAVSGYLAKFLGRPRSAEVLAHAG
jgi:hypothetical protein